MNWKIEDTGSSAASLNMLYDTMLLQSSKIATLRFYDWKQPSATYGYFIKPEDFFDSTVLHSSKIDLAKRPTGGGILFHIWDFTFSILIPASHPAYSVNTLQNYSVINQAVAKAIQQFDSSLQILFSEESPSKKHSFCMAAPTKYDLLVSDKKVCGAAQRRTKAGILHQGTIALAHPPYDWIAPLLKNEKNLVRQMQSRTFPLLHQDCTPSEIVQAKKMLKKALASIIPENVR